MTIKLKAGYSLGLLSFLILFSCSVSIPVLGYEVDSILMVDDIDPVSSAPVGSGEEYLTNSGYTYCWVNLTEVYLSHVVRFNWYTPEGELFESRQITTDSPESGQHFPSYAVYDYLGIYGHAPASDPGRWNVSVYVDDSLVGSRQFSIIDYDAIIEKTDALESQVAEIVSSVDQLVSNYESTQDLYEELLSEYNELRDTYDSLTITYEDQMSDYNEILVEITTLQDEYNVLAEDNEEMVQSTIQLADDYVDVINYAESLATLLSNSRNMTYVSVALAVVFLGAAIYVYMKK
jgi:hypothetical protein